MAASRYFALVPAAGIGARLGADCPKQYLPLAGKPMLQHVLEAFGAAAAIAQCFVVVSPDDGYIAELMRSAPQLRDRVTVLYNGGATRHQSVLNGLQQMRGKVADDDWVLVHDAARPGLTGKLIAQLIEALHQDPVGGLLAMPVVDTLKRSNPDGRVVTTVSRADLWAAQTPQMFRYAVLRQALEQAGNVTDEASAIEAIGLLPKLVEGNIRNFKVTHPQDIALAEQLLKGLT